MGNYSPPLLSLDLLYSQLFKGIKFRCLLAVCEVCMVSVQYKAYGYKFGKINACCGPFMRCTTKGAIQYFTCYSAML